ncbi:MAG: reverse transcriptase domain-containing protein, partial [Gaiellaceae bacterium]
MAHLTRHDTPALEELSAIVNHEWHDNALLVRCQFDSDTMDWLPADTVKADHPLTLAKYILANPVEQTRQGSWAVWARNTLRTTPRTIRRFYRLLASSSLNDMDDDSPATRPDTQVNTCRRQTKPGANHRSHHDLQFGITVPRNVKEALTFDRQDGNQSWAEAMSKEMTGRHGCFEFHDSDFKVSPDYQCAPLCMIFTVKSGGRHKARLVIGGHVVDASHLMSYSSVVQGISIRLLCLIAKANDLRCLSGDIANAYVNAPTQERIYSRAGAEFGPKQGCIIIIKKALYGLKTSGAEWHAHFADSLRALGFIPTRYDPNVWYIDRG